MIGPVKQNNSDPFHFFDLTSFAIPCTGEHAQGAERRTSPTASPAHDISETWEKFLARAQLSSSGTSRFSRTLRSPRGSNLQLRAEFFNILNHPNFASPILPAFAADSDPWISVSGKPGSRQRVQSLQATGDVGIGNPFLGGGGPRGIQFSAQFKF